MREGGLVVILLDVVLPARIHVLQRVVGAAQHREEVGVLALLGRGGRAKQLAFAEALLGGGAPCCIGGGACAGAPYGLPPCAYGLAGGAPPYGLVGGWPYCCWGGGGWPYCC